MIKLPWLLSSREQSVICYLVFVILSSLCESKGNIMNTLHMINFIIHGNKRAPSQIFFISVFKNGKYQTRTIAIDVRCYYSADLRKLGDEEETEYDDEQPRGSVCPHLPPGGSITHHRVLLSSGHCACAPDLVRRGHRGRGGAGAAQLLRPRPRHHQALALANTVNLTRKHIAPI